MRGAGVKGSVPQAYMQLQRQFYAKIVASNQQQRITMREYLQGGTTFHAKGRYLQAQAPLAYAYGCWGRLAPLAQWYRSLDNRGLVQLWVSLHPLGLGDAGGLVGCATWAVLQVPCYWSVHAILLMCYASLVRCVCFAQTCFYTQVVLETTGQSLQQALLKARARACTPKSR